MNALITYIVATIVSLGIFYAGFAIFLRKEPLFRFNRAYLLSSLVLSQLIPLITFIPKLSSQVLRLPAGGDLLNTITLPKLEINPAESGVIPLNNLLTYFYLAGMTIFICRLAIRLLSIYNLRRKGTFTCENQNVICWIDSNIPPFSFFKTLYLPVNLQGNNDTNEIIRHEKIHITSLHSFDILITQILQILCWFNPFIILTEKALREIHEFEADKAVISSGTDPVMYTRILFTQDKTALAVVLGNNFNYSLIKRRLTMFYRKNTRFARMKSILVLPVAIGMVMIYSVGCRQSTDSIAPPPPPPPPPPPTEIPSAGDQIFTVVENMPQFPGGEDARVKYMAKNLLYPESAIKNQTEGTVYVSFVVEKDGSVNEVKILRGVGGEIDSEAFRVVKNMPKWSPGLQNGQAVRVQFTLPVKFKLSDNGKSGMINFGKDK